MEAANAFDPERGTFANFAHARIRGAILDELNRQGQERFMQTEDNSPPMAVSMDPEPSDSSATLASAMAELPERSRRAPRRGALGWRGKRTLRRTGEELGVGFQRVKQIEAKA